MNIETIKRLEDLIERAEKIRKYSYLRGGEKIISFEISRKDGQLIIDYSQPNWEETDALLFNLRVFVQNKDDISIGRLEDLLADPDLSDRWKNEYRELREQLSERLGRIAVQGTDEFLTYGEVFRMVLYGKLAHRKRDDKQYKLFQKWVTDANHWEHTLHTFHQVVIWVLTVVINISVASKEELQRIGFK